MDLCSVNFSIVFVTMLHAMQSLKATRKYHPHDTPTHIGILYQAYANARIATQGMTGLDLEEYLLRAQPRVCIGIPPGARRVQGASASQPRRGRILASE